MKRAMKIALSALAMVAHAHAAIVSLGSYNVDIHDSSVSGLSSGAFMANQFEVAYSSIIKGAGIIAGGPYDCAGQLPYTNCMYAGQPDPRASQYMTQIRSGNAIDNMSNLASHKVFMLSGTQDATVGQGVMNSLYAYYTSSGLAPVGNVLYKNDLVANHTFPTDQDHVGNINCLVSFSPYISNCGYDAAGALLQQIYGPLNPRNNGAPLGSWVQFGQSDFAPNLMSIGMDWVGWLYVPPACAQGEQCKLHVAFHGCLQSYGAVGRQFIENTGYTRWADTNNIMVLFPQAISDTTVHLTARSGYLPNPNGCWDWVGWYGNTGNNVFDTHNGAQIAAVRNMLSRITAGYAALPAPTGVTTTMLGGSSVNVSWNAVAGATGYNLYLNGMKVNAAPITVANSTQNSLPTGATYVYTVRAVNAALGQGPASSPATVTIPGTPLPAPAPNGLNAQVTADGVTLGWQGSGALWGFNVYRAATSGGPYVRINGNSPLQSIKYNDGLVSGNTYYWVVRGVTRSGVETANSNEVTATAQAQIDCYTDSNVNHVASGRGYVIGGAVFALGTGQSMGLYSATVLTTLKAINDRSFSVVSKAGSCS